MEVRHLIAPDSHTLREQWWSLRQSQPNLRIRNAAEALGVSELALRLTEGTERVIRLRPAFAALYARLAQLGPVMTLARNDEVVHETIGRVGKLSLNKKSQHGLCLGEIDLRLFFSHWRHACAVVESGGHGDRYSLQFFDGSGAALHKIYATDATDLSAWEALLSDFREPGQHSPLSLHTPSPLKRHRGWVDSEALRLDWQSLTDVHQFHGMLKRHGLDRLTALEKIGTDWAAPVPADSLRQVMGEVARAAIPIMVFVGNRGVIQIYTGKVKRLVEVRGWFNVLDSQFNLHLAIDRLRHCYVVRKPSADGLLTSLEAFNAAGELVITLFGARKPGQSELPAWRALLNDLALESCA